jgi:hypothetical protein
MITSLLLRASHHRMALNVCFSVNRFIPELATATIFVIFVAGPRPLDFAPYLTLRSRLAVLPDLRIAIPVIANSNRRAGFL